MISLQKGVYYFRVYSFQSRFAASGVCTCYPEESACVGTGVCKFFLVGDKNIPFDYKVHNIYYHNA